MNSLSRSIKDHLKQVTCFFLCVCYFITLAHAVQITYISNVFVMPLTFKLTPGDAVNHWSIRSHIWQKIHLNIINESYKWIKLYVKKCIPCIFLMWFIYLFWHKHFKDFFISYMIHSFPHVILPDDSVIFMILLYQTFPLHVKIDELFKRIACENKMNHMSKLRGKITWKNHVKTPESLEKINQMKVKAKITCKKNK